MSKDCQKTSLIHTDTDGNLYCQCYNSFESVYHLIKHTPDLKSNKKYLCGKEGIAFPSTNKHPARLKCVECFSFLETLQKDTDDKRFK
jgi:hypothetical protein